MATLGVFAQWFVHEALAETVLHGFKIVAVSVVATALWGMGRALCPDRMRATMAVAAAVAVTAVPSPLMQSSVMILGALWGKYIEIGETPTVDTSLPAAEVQPSTQVHSISAKSATHLLIVFALVLVTSYILYSYVFPEVLILNLWEGFYVVGSTVFGGGHVVLPLLRTIAKQRAWLSDDLFLMGYGAVQVMPGPMFAISAFLGAAAGVTHTQESGVEFSSVLNGYGCSLVAVVAIFLPGYLLVAGAFPFWSTLRYKQGAKSAMRGVNAVVVGLLLSAFYTPVWTSAVLTTTDFCVVAVSILLFSMWEWTSWMIAALAILSTIVFPL